jgi:anti-anti-sigma factor
MESAMVRIEQHQMCRKVSIDSEMTIYNAAELKASLQPLVLTPGDIEISLANVHEIDSAGIQLLMLMKMESSVRQQGMTLTEHSPAVLDVFELMGLLPWFNDPVILTRGGEHGA